MEEAVVGNGFMTVMLDQNGSLYDIYFPSVGIRSGNDTANEGYRGPQNWPACPSLDDEANGQMNLIAAMGGIGLPAAAQTTCTGPELRWHRLRQHRTEMGQ